MSLSSTTSRQAPYTGDGSTATYAYGFKIFSDSDLKVQVENISTGALTTLTKTTDYTVTGVGETTGGNVVLVDASQAWLDGSGYLTSSYKLLIRRKPSLKQETSIRNQGDFYPSAHEDQFDKLVMIDQSQQDELDRSVKLPESVTSSDFDPTLPVDIETANTVVIVNPAGDGFTMGPTAGEISSAQAYATAASDSADAAATSETNAAASETAAAASEVAAAASAASAAAALASAIFRDVVYVDNSDSPITIAQADNGKLYSIDSSGGAVSITLPAIAGLTLPFNVTFVLRVAGNPVTINRSSTDTIAGETSKIISIVNEAAQLVADTDSAPDDWGLLSFGSSSDSSSSGSKTYIDSASANIESSIGSWETDNGAGSAASYLTITRNTTTPLAGTGDLSLAKSANDATGEFIKLDSQTIDIADRGGALFGSFSYDATDANYSSGDLIVEVYDVTNAAVLYSGVSDDLEILQTAGKFQFVTYTESTTAQIELRIKINSTNATTYTVYLDEFKLGPAPQVQGVYRNSVTLSMNGSGNFTDGVVKVDRVGNNVTVTTTTAPAHSSLEAAYSAAGFIPSWARPSSIQNNMTNNGSSLMWTTYMGTDGQFGVAYRNYSGTLTASTGGGVLTISYPVDDIAQPTVTENELSLQTIRVTSQVSTANHTSTGNYQDVSFTEDRDTHGAFDGTTFTAPRSGFYTFYAHVQFGTSATGRRGVQVVLTSADDASIPGNLLPASTTGAFGILATGTVYMQKGGTAKVQGFQDSGGNLAYDNGVFSVVGNPDYTTLGVVKSEPVYVEARGSDGDPLTADVTNIEWTEVTDTHGAWADNQFTAPKTAYYMLSGVVRFQAAEGPPDLYIDGTIHSSLGGNSAGTQESFAINWQGKLTKGQILTIRSSTSAATYAGGSESTDHWITILER